MDRPVFRPAAVSAEDTMAAVDPLPLVPVMWTYLSFLWGSPTFFSSAAVRLSPGLRPVQAS